MLEGYIAKKWGNKIFEKDILKIVHSHARWAALIIPLPLFGFEQIIFIIMLWDMYDKLCAKAGTTLTFSSILVAIVVNLLVSFRIDFTLTFIPIFGWLSIAAITYFQFYLSGKAYIKLLRDGDAQ